jgi:hypothetical protein
VAEITGSSGRRSFIFKMKSFQILASAISSYDRMPQSVLAVLTVTDRPVGLVEIVLCHPQKNARPDIQTEYDLASLGEVESIHGPFCDPPRWMVSYKGKVSAEKGDWIRLKD